MGIWLRSLALRTIFPPPRTTGNLVSYVVQKIAVQYWVRTIFQCAEFLVENRPTSIYLSMTRIFFLPAVPENTHCKYRRCHRTIIPLRLSQSEVTPTNEQWFKILLYHKKCGLCWQGTDVEVLPQELISYVRQFWVFVHYCVGLYFIVCSIFGRRLNQGLFTY